VVSYGSGALLAFSAVVKFVGVNNANPLKLLYSNAPLNGVDILVRRDGMGWDGMGRGSLILCLNNDRVEVVQVWSLTVIGCQFM